MKLSVILGLCIHFWNTAGTQGNSGSQSNIGLFPSVFNLAGSAAIIANATCGDRSSEVYCKLNLDPSLLPSNQDCGICDASERNKAHPISLAIDGQKNTWWQAPSLQFGPDYHFITITVDLKKIFQVGYVLMESGVSPRPGNWILERSLDGVDWAPWQFFAISDEECWHAFGVEPRQGKPSYRYDDEVICTSYYSKLDPLENGEIHVSLVNGRPGASGPSRTLIEFTLARYIRIRFRRLRILPHDQQLVNGYSYPDATVLRRYFYSLRDLTIGGQCPCNGHASECPINHLTMDYECKCKHNTCGPLCNQCCPMYNQKLWRQGKFITANKCERCQCFGHADECFFDPQVEAERRSLNTEGKFEGGGVCIDCRHHTAGINCEYCKEGFYRPLDKDQFDSRPCVRCECSGLVGSKGKCYNNADAEKLIREGVQPGDCVCKPGFTGPRCDRCQLGFHNYPSCEPCPCTLAGTLNGVCSGLCTCKSNVEGRRCDRCKRGYFALHENHAQGCLECFCNGITDQCETADLGVELLQHAEGWKVTDLRGRLLVEPYWSTLTNGVTVAEEDMQGIETYFWQAPEQYIGNKLVSYGLRIKILTSWHTGRGDTAGTATNGPDIIIEGWNGMIIGFGSQRYRNMVNASINIDLHEKDWYHIPNTLFDIEARSFIGERPDFIGKEVSKIEFMQVINNIQRFLIRGKYHTDQLECTLHTASMEFGTEQSLNLRKTIAIEQCFCPPGYEGSSCESCSYGYTRRNETIFRGQCIKCNCHGHAATCDPFTLRCGTCEHNTRGQHCEQCLPGFYGNPLQGTPGDCRPCKCPLDITSNNFSPTCVQATLDYDRYSLAPEEYICNACPRGYAGPHCERCDNGYFGNPLQIGDYCKPCHCNGNANIYAPNWCDHRSGECLQCLGNTAGWSCNQCKDGYYGNPLSGQCKACDCNKYGSLSRECDPITGSCDCKNKYVGRRCSQCRDGFGNVAAGCRLCNCDLIGSKSDVCDPDTGACDCLPGVTGIACGQCLPLHYGFLESPPGCQSCDCHPKGASEPFCHENNGQCQCLSKVVGQKCDRCLFGYWNINSGSGCEKCNCDAMGAYDTDCDDKTGQCRCKTGVGELSCSSCLEGYWGFSSRGCIKCFPCNKPGHICDPDTGRCVCPALTEGSACERCSPGTWSLDRYKGCRYCSCHPKGSVSEQCDLDTGKCRCLEGFQGDKCDRCSTGHYNFPHCWPCNCDAKGTKPSECNDRKNSCSCDLSGGCECKSLVEGKKCASCVPGTFGLTLDNPEGCTRCFCFGRTSQCRQANYIWNQLTSIMQTHRKLTITRGNTRLEVSHGLLIIPGDNGDIVIGVERLFTTPLYWSLPEVFLGDKVLSYNGFLRFSTSSNGDTPNSLLSNPLVQIQSHERIIFEHFPLKISSSGRYEVRFHEKFWVQKGTRLPVTRELLMIALQNVERILIRATDLKGATVAELKGATLDHGVVATEPGTNPLALGVEICQCPDKYSGSSCQNPGKGYYRSYKRNYKTSTNLIDLVGFSKRCQCNGRASECHPETGHCRGCRQWTTGPLCDLCSGGYYGNPLLGEKCKPCHCPSAENNHAATCSLDVSGEFICQCKTGYTGPKCNRCDYGFYGRSDQECLPCNCNPHGSLSDQCDQNTGQCYCVQGVTGRDCSQCQPRQVLVKNGRCKNCDHPCVEPLLDTMDGIEAFFDNANVSDIDPAPMLKLMRFQDENSRLEEILRQTKKDKEIVENGHKIITAIRPHAELTMLEAKKYKKAAFSQDDKGHRLNEQCVGLDIEASSLLIDVEGIVRRLKNYGVTSMPQVSIQLALEEARRILAEIKQRSYGSESDIRARTELSYARQSFNMVKEILFGQDKLHDQQNAIEVIENKIDDLLKSLNEAMDQTRDGLLANQNHHNIYIRSQKNCESITELEQDAQDKMSTSTELLQKSKEQNRKAKKMFREIGILFDKLQGSLGLELDEKSTGLFTTIQDYKVRLFEPCNKYSTELLRISDSLLGTFGSDLGMGAEQTLRAANAYHKILKTILDASKIADETMILAQKALDRVNLKNEDGYDLYAQTDEARVHSRDLRQESEGLQKNAQEMQIQMEELILRWNSYLLMISKRADDLEEVDRNLDRLQIVSVMAETAVRQSNEAFREADNVHTKVVKAFMAIKNVLWTKVKELQSFSPDELGNIPRKLKEARRHLLQIDKRATYLSRRKVDLEEIGLKVQRQIHDVRSRIAMARHAADSVRISITNQRYNHPEATAWGCSRSYRVNLTSSTSNSISLIYAVSDYEEKNGLLVYLPSGEPGLNTLDDRRDFMAIEMVDRKIRFLWNNGAGTASITHNATIDPVVGGGGAYNDQMWYKITAERIGNIGRLNVRKVRPEYVRPEYNRWEVKESSISANVFNLHRQDLLYVGGGAIPDELKSLKLESGGKFAGIMYNLEVDGRNVGLWNFVTNSGCRETHSGITQEMQMTESCFTFQGNGYAMQQDIRNYDPRYLSLALEFKSFDANTLLFYGVNEYTRQHLLLEIRDGRIFMEINYGPEKQLAFLTSNTYNGGSWVKVEAARALRNNVETGVLRVTLNGVQEDLMDTIALPRSVDFLMDKCLMFFGGLPPDYHDRFVKKNRLLKRRPFNSFLGQMRAITVSNPGSNSLINPLYTQRFKANPYFGVQAHCDRKLLKESSFNGDAYLEVKSQSLRQTCSFGFNFQTFLANAVLILSTFYGQQSSGNGNDLNKNYYSLSLVDGKLQLKLSSVSGSGKPLKFLSREIFNDGEIHSVFVTKNDNRFNVYVDDKLINESGGIFLQENNGNNEIPAPSNKGLYIGGIPYLLRDVVEKANLIGSVNGLVGTIGDVVFIDDMSVRVIDMNEPITIERAQIGRAMYFPQIEWEFSEMSSSSISWQSMNFPIQNQQPDQSESCGNKNIRHHEEKVKNGVFFNRLLPSYLRIKLQKPDRHRQLNLQFYVRPDGGHLKGTIFAIAPNSLHRKSHHAIIVLSIRRFNQIWVQILHNTTDIIESNLSQQDDILLENHQWSKIEIRRQGNRLFFYVNNRHRKTLEITRGQRLAHFLHFGGLPKHIINRFGGKFENVPYNGCIRSLLVNQASVDLWAAHHDTVNLNVCLNNSSEGIYFDAMDALTFDVEDLNEITFEANIDDSNVDKNMLLMGEGSIKKSFQMLIDVDEVTIVDLTANKFSKIIARYSWTPCTWNRVEIKKKNFDSLIIKVGHVEKQLKINDLKKLTIGKGIKGCIRKLLFDGKLNEQTNRLSGSAQLGSCPRQ